MSRSLLGGIATLAVLAAAANAQTVTVDTSADVIDVDWQTATIADLPGPDGLVSFSEAMIATDNTPGHQRVEFAIPQSEWTLQFLYPGRAVLQSIAGTFFRSSDDVTIDGSTQTAFTGDTNPDGAEVVIHGVTLYLNGDNSTLIGFDSSSIQISGSNGVARDNTGVNLTLFGGSGSTLQDNTGGTIKIDRSNDNVVVGNTVQRVRVLGGGATQPALNNRIGGPDPGDRNFLTGYGYVNSEGLPGGAAVQLSWANGTLIENNSIGTTPDGLAQGNLACTMGINFQSENHDVTVLNNRIAGILGRGQGPHHAGQLFGWAIYFWGSTTNIQIIGNTIGLDANGDATLGSVWGVNVDNFSWYTVEGISLVDNVIAGNYFNGVRVGPTATMRLSRNAIYDNGWIGIDLIPDDFSYGVSPNDPLDPDTGGNAVQNFPVVASATLEGTGMRVVGTLASEPLSDYTVELFASPACDASGFGQGSVFLGSTSVTTDAGGAAAFDVPLAASAPPGWQVTSTATLEPLGATSEFSACVELLGQTAAVFCTGPEAEAACPCGNVGQPGHGCDNAQGTGGVALGASGDPARNDVVLTGTGFPPTAAPTVVVIRSPGREPAPVVFGDGVRCISATGLVRVDARPASQGTSTHPLSHGAGAGTFDYQLWYRNNPAAFCNAAAAFNLSGGLELVWPQ